MCAPRPTEGGEQVLAPLVWRVEITLSGFAGIIWCSYAVSAAVIQFCAPAVRVITRPWCSWWPPDGWSGGVLPIHVLLVLESESQNQDVKKSRMVLGAIRVKPSHTPDRRPGKTERLSCSWWMKKMHFGLCPTLCVKKDLKKLMEIYLIQRINLDTAHKRIWNVGNQYENKRALYVIGDTLKKTK